jgi:hypothetical protein
LGKRISHYHFHPRHQLSLIRASAAKVAVSHQKDEISIVDSVLEGSRGS